MWINPASDLVLIAAIFVVISQTIQTVLVDRREMRKTQKKMKEKNKEYRELAAQGNNANKTEMERVQKEMMSLSTQSMKQMPKLMIVNMVIFLPLFGLVHQVYDGIQIPLFFPLNLVWDKADWYWFYVLMSLLISMVVNKAFEWNENKKEAAQKNTVTVSHEKHENHTHTTNQNHNEKQEND